MRVHRSGASTSSAAAAAKDNPRPRQSQASAFFTENSLMYVVPARRLSPPRPGPEIRPSARARALPSVMEVALLRQRDAGAAHLLGEILLLRQAVLDGQ